MFRIHWKFRNLKNSNFLNICFWWKTNLYNPNMDMPYIPYLDWWCNHSDWRSNTLFGSQRLRQNPRISVHLGSMGAPIGPMHASRIRTDTPCGHGHGCTCIRGWTLFFCFRFSPIRSDLGRYSNLVRNAPKQAPNRSNSIQNGPKQASNRPDMGRNNC